MIKSDVIKIKVKGCRKLDYFKSIGYEIREDYLEINVKDLNVGSREIVNVICDFCSSESSVTYKEYLRNILNSGKFACSKKCGSQKSKETNIQKLGVDHPLKLQEFRDKQAKTNLLKFGVEFLQQSETIREKTKNTYLENFGVEHISQTRENRKRSKDWTSSQEFKMKSRKTLFENYGVENPTQSEEIQQKIKINNLSKWGFEHPMKSEVIKQKLKDSLLSKFLVDNITKFEFFRKNNFEIAKDENYICYEENGVCSFRCDNKLVHTFSIPSDIYFKRKSSKLTLCTVCYPTNEISSIKEKNLLDFIKSIYNGEILESYRDKIEIDIYLPELKIGFEFNGLYWHSDKFKDKNSHLNKTKYFLEKNIRIIHIWEDDWLSRNEIVKSQISNWVGLTKNKIFARKCQINIIEKTKLSTNFLNENHIQGVDKSKVKVGLFFENEIVSIMTFNKIEGRDLLGEREWNLSRFCNKSNYNVVGGASKLLNYFIKEFNPKRIISYADKSWSNGQLYEKIGFKKVSDSEPDYKYIINGVRRNKSNFKKNNLKTNLSESQEMKKREILKVWDCGKTKFEMNLNYGNL